MTPAARSRRTAWWTALVAVLVAACGGGEDGPTPPGNGAESPPPEGTALVVGTSLDDWSLLAVPRDGGTVEARSVRDPSRVVWEGSTGLPAAGEIHLLAGPLVVLRTPDGGVYRYDPRADSLSRVGEVSGEARWTAWEGYGLFTEPGGGQLLEVGPEGVWRYRVSRRPRWAGPAEGGRIATLVESSGEDGSPPDLWMLGRGESEPVARAGTAYTPPALVTAWGTRLVAVGRGGAELRFVTVPELTRSDAVDLGGPVRALTASPSSHEIYAGVGAPPRILRVNRFAAEAEEMVRLDRDVREIRPAALGRFLLLDDGGAPLWVPLDGGPRRRLEGQWRSDLPLGSPDGRVLLVTGDALRIWDPDREDGPRPLEAPAARWWGAVRWNPAPPTVIADRVGTGRRPGASDTAAGVPAPRPEGGTAAGEDTAGTGEAPGTAAVADSLRRRGEVPAGHYAVVVAAQDTGGVRRLLDDLQSSGWPTELQEHRDDAGELWYRGMVGPYGSRERAEAAARQLRRERGTSVWVTEVRAGTMPEEIFR